MKLFKFLFPFLLCVAAFGSNTSVTLNVTDLDGTAWVNGTWAVSLTNPPGVNPGPYFIKGTTTPVSNQTQSGNLDGTGSATFTVTDSTTISPSGSQWSIVVCAQAQPAPCYARLVTISGASYSAFLNPPAIRINLALGVPYRVLAYTDVEVSTGAGLGNFYFNLGSNQYRVCASLPCSSGFTSMGSAGTGLPAGCTAVSGGTGISCTGPLSGSQFTSTGSGQQFVLGLGDNPTITPVVGQYTLGSQAGVYSLWDLNGNPLGQILTASQFNVAQGIPQLDNNITVPLTELVTNPGSCTGSNAILGNKSCGILSSVTNQISIANDSTTGTVTNMPSFITSTGAKSATGAVTFVDGICTANCGTTGNATLSRGNSPCLFDGGTTTGHLTSVGSTGKCHDAGVNSVANFASILLSGSTVIGIVQSTNGAAGTYTICQGVDCYAAAYAAVNTIVNGILLTGVSGNAAGVVQEQDGTPILNAIPKYDGAGAAGGLSNSDFSNPVADQFAGNGATTVVETGQPDTSTNTVLAGITIRGSNQLGAGGSGSSSGGGPALLLGGNNSTGSATSTAGPVEVRAGQSNGLTPGLQGLIAFVGSFAQSGTVTQWNLQCLSGAKTTSDCGANPTAIVGVALSKNGAVQVGVAGPGSEVPINASAAVTVGDSVCAGATAGKVTDSGGIAPCVGAATVGYVEAISGAYQAYPDGTTFPTLSSTLPLVLLTQFTQSTSAVASGSVVLNPGALGPGSCAAAVQGANAAVLAGDNFHADFSADPTGTTGYSPSTTGILSIIKWATNGNVNFKVCNNTQVGITPGSITVNWKLIK